MTKYFILLFIAYLVYRLAKSAPKKNHPVRSSEKKKNDSSLGIREKDIRDADYKDLDD